MRRTACGFRRRASGLDRVHQGSKAARSPLEIGALEGQQSEGLSSPPAISVEARSPRLRKGVTVFRARFIARDRSWPAFTIRTRHDHLIGSSRGLPGIVELPGIVLIGRQSVFFSTRGSLRCRNRAREKHADHRQDCGVRVESISSDSMFWRPFGVQIVWSQVFFLSNARL